MRGNETKRNYVSSFVGMQGRVPARRPIRASDSDGLSKKGSNQSLRMAARSVSSETLAIEVDLSLIA